MFLNPHHPMRTYYSSRDWTRPLARRPFAAPSPQRQNDDDDLLQRAAQTAAAAVRLEQGRNAPLDPAVQARFITASYYRAMGEPYPAKRKDIEAIGPDGHILPKDCTASFIVESYLRARAEI